MATIPQLPSSLFFSTFHFRKPLFYSHQQKSQIFVSYFNSTKKKNGFICFACSIKQTRVRKRVKSNEELRSEIMEFVALNGFPQGHVPSMKELSAHGRVDLANVVRRRGYKFIRELLANSDMEQGYKELISEENTKMEASSSGICLEDSLTEGQSEEALDVVVDGKLYTERFASTEIGLTAIDGSMHTDQKMISFPDEDDIANLSPEAEECGSVSRDESSLAGVSSMGNTLLNLGDSKHSGEIIENSLKTESVEFNNRADIVNSTSEASISDQSLLLDDASSCSDREVDNLLMTEDTETNNVEDHYTSQDLNYTEHVDIATESFSTKNFQNQQIDDMAESYPDSADDSLVVGSDDEDSMLGLSSSMLSIEEKTTRFIQNGYLDTVEVSDDENEMPNDKCPEETKERAETSKGGEYIGDTYGGQRSVSSPLNGSALALEEAIHATEVNSSDRNTDQREDLDPHDETRKRENQVEITRLRFMLRQKELELSRLKEQIEKEKLSLSVLQRQAETEIQKAQMLISEKDVELQEAEGSLSGLQEVEIEYCGDGNVVEVTGSFNGWEHRVGLELKPSKSIGKQKYWSTLLWLYPGTYELKFIVDGQWTTDPQRDSVTRGHITNNILKVDR